IVFALICGISVILLIMARFISKTSSEEISKWWFDGPELKDAYYFIVYPFKLGKNGRTLGIPFGYPLLLGISYFFPAIFGAPGIFIALGLGGIVLAIQLHKTQSIFVPWITHFIYNATAIVLSGYSVVPLSASPIYVPNFQFEGISGFLDVLSRQIGLQFIAVSLAEEFMKVSMMAGAFMLLRSSKGLAIVISTIAWVLMHSILAYRI